MCLATIRHVIEQGMGWKPYHLYEHYITEWVQPEGYPKGDGHWARDFERSARNLGWQIDLQEMQPGDILCHWQAAWSNRWGAYIGHIGVLLERDYVFENISARYRSHSFMSGALALTPLESFPVTSIFRIPDSVG